MKIMCQTMGKYVSQFFYVIFFIGAKLLMTLVPSQESTVRQFFWKLNLDPDDNEENAKTPTGIGNMVAKLIFESCRNDGMNLNGGWDVGGNLRSANVLPFKDYTGYEPVNTINSLSKPERWQPGQTVFHPGIYSSQQFLTPQMRLVTPFTFEDITQFSLDPHARMPVEVRRTFFSDNICGENCFDEKTFKFSYFINGFFIYHA